MSLGIPDAMLDAMRAQVALLLPGTAILYSMTAGTSDPYGGTATYTPVSGGTVSCRVDPLGQNASSELDYNLSRETVTVMYRCTLPHDAPVDAGQRVEIDSVNYEIVQLSVDHSWNVSKRIIITREES